MASAALQAFRRRVTVDWPKGAVEDARKRLVAVAKAGHAKIMADQKARSGAVPEFDAYANAPGNANLDTVVLPGPIVYRYRYMREVVQFALDELRKASPVQSGDYVRGHTIYYNGVEVASIPVRFQEGDEIILSNPVAYARKIEIGKTESGRDFVIQVPNRIYERVAKQKLIPRYRNVAKISFAYITPPNAYTYQKNNAARSWMKSKSRWYTHKKQRADRAKGAAVLAPAIIIEALS